MDAGTPQRPWRRRLAGSLPAVTVSACSDQANPTSNAIYQRLGYEPVVDMVNLLVTARS